MLGATLCRLHHVHKLKAGIIAFLESSLSSASLSGVGGREGLRFSKSSAMTFSEK